MAGMGAMTQLLATGPQDYQLVEGWEDEGWLQYTRFAFSTQNVPFPSGIQFGQHAQVTVPLSVSDVLCNMFLEVVLPPECTWIRGVGRRVVKNFRVLLGDVVLLDIDDLFQEICDELHTPKWQQQALHMLLNGTSTADGLMLTIPLHLLFVAPDLSPGLPLIAMTGARMQIDITLADWSDLVIGNPPIQNSLTGCLNITTAILDSPERISFLAKPYDLLADRIIYQDFATIRITNNHDTMPLANLTLDLTFMQGSVKQIIFVFLDQNAQIVDCLVSYSFLVNNIPTEPSRIGKYLQDPSAYRSCTACSDSPIHTINLALHSSSKQPSGCLDMNQVSSCTLSLQLVPGVSSLVRVYSVSHRLLQFANNTVRVV